MKQTFKKRGIVILIGLAIGTLDAERSARAETPARSGFAYQGQIKQDGLPPAGDCAVHDRAQALFTAFDTVSTTLAAVPREPATYVVLDTGRIQ